MRLTLAEAVRAYHATLRLLNDREAAVHGKPRRTGWDAAYVSDARQKHSRATRGLNSSREVTR